MDQLSAVLGAVSHPSRREIIARLTKGPARVTEIARPFDMSLNAVSKHLKVLEEAGLISRERQGREHLIELRPEPLQHVARWLHPYEKFWGEQLDRMENYFIESKKK